MLPLLPIFAYAETHYRFRYGFTLLSRRVPEILFDAPFRIEPGRGITAVLIIKDADRFPIELLKIKAAILLCGKHRIFLPEVESAKRNLTHPFFHQILRFPVPDDCQGSVSLNFKLEFLRKGKPDFVFNDNLPQGTHAPLEVAVSGHPLPRPMGWVYGETHCHTHFTSDQIEFGAPLAVIPELAAALGLSFAFATDHSYDLDPGSPFQPDKNAFENMQRLSAEFSNPDFCLVPGEEVSVHNSRKRIVHLAAINCPEYLPGDGDAGRSRAGLGASLSIADALTRISRHPGTLSFAAHPGVCEGILEGIFLNRGRWNMADFSDNLAATQFWDGRLNKAFFRGRQQWIDRLLKGHHFVFIGGNDAHGDFNRTRKIGFPFLYTAESRLPRFGQVRTVVKTDALTPAGIVSAIIAGRVVVTSGPFVTLTSVQDGRSYSLGETVQPGKQALTLQVISTPEFGQIRSINLYRGILGKVEEKIMLPQPVNTSVYSQEITFELEMLEPGYLRAEVSSGNSNEVFFGFTNPLWISCKSKG